MAIELPNVGNTKLVNDHPGSGQLTLLSGKVLA
jgi:hypothetical protein